MKNLNLHILKSPHRLHHHNFELLGYCRLGTRRTDREIVHYIKCEQPERPQLVFNLRIEYSEKQKNTNTESSFKAKKKDRFIRTMILNDTKIQQTYAVTVFRQA